MNLFKRGSRVLAIAESFDRQDRYSVLAGVVYRLDRGFDGIQYRLNTVGGLDSTKNIIDLIEGFGREDINVIVLSGVVLSWYNIVDLDELYHTFGKPIVALTYDESEGLIPYLVNMPRWEERLLLYLRLGDRVEVTLKTGKRIYVRSIGISIADATRLLNQITIEGGVPEPIRIARQAAYAASKLIRSIQ